MWLGDLYRRVRGLLRSESIHEEIDEEMQFHIDMRTEENVRAGMRPDDARRDAERRFGNRTRMKERGYEVRGGRWVETLWQDLRFGARMLLKSPGFTFVCAVSLAVGIGVNTTVFSFINTALFKSLPISNTDGLVYFFESDQKRSYSTSSYANYLDYRDQNEVFSGLMASAPIPLLMTLNDRVEELNAEVVSGNYFSVLDVKPLVGRAILPEDDQLSSTQPVAVISYKLWERRFNSDQSIIGKQLTLNGNSFRVIGVNAPGFTGTTTETSADVWVPITQWALIIQRWSRTVQTAEQARQSAERKVSPGQRNSQAETAEAMRQNSDRLNRGHSWLSLIGRLRPGVSIEQAQSVMTNIAVRVQSSYGTPPEGLKATLSPVTQMHPAMREEGLPAALLIMVVTGLILAICCVNVVSFTLARAATRQKEFAVRLAIGGTRRRLIQQLLTESVMVSLVGGVLGLLLTFWILYALIAFLPPGETSFIDNVEIDKTVLGFSVLISLVTGVAFGLVPAVNASKPNLLRSLRDEVRSVGVGASRLNLRRVLIAAQIAVSLVLLISAGLFVRSLQNGQALSRDSTGDDILLLSLSPKSYGFKIKYGSEFYRQIADRVGSMPGVRSATLSHALPLSFDKSTTSIKFEGEEEPHTVSHAVVGTRYFETLRIPLARGRDFTSHDNESAPKVAIVNEAMARAYWGGNEPVGRRFRFGDRGEFYEVVGVARDSQYTNFGKPPLPYLYVPLYQRPKEDVTLIVRSIGEPLALIPMLKREINDLGGELPIFDFKTLSDVSKLQLIPVQAAAMLLGLLGAIGLMVAAIGIYGVTTYSVNQRKHEIGVRLALGAQQSQVLKLILKEGMGLALVGIGVGLLIALGTTHFVSSFLYGISPMDPTTFAAVSAILAAVSLVASFIPARKAAQMNPMDAMRYE